MVAELATRLRESDGGILRIAGHGTCPAPQVVAQIESRAYNLTPHFDTRKAVLKAGDEAKLKSIINEWRGASNVKVIALGHTDNIGIALQNRKEFKDNYALSNARANAVVRYVQNQLGLADSQINSSGRGPDIPIASNATATGRAANRRVELRISGDLPGAVVSTVQEPCTDIARARAQSVYDMLKQHLGDDKICKVSFQSSSQTYTSKDCGGEL